jgi:hypothetical protein
MFIGTVVVGMAPAPTAVTSNSSMYTRYSRIKLPCGSRPRHPATDPALRMALHHAQDALQWRSGSVALGPSGQACRGWLQTLPAALQVVTLVLGLGAEKKLGQPFYRR